jgi:glucose dehydrogenase
LVTIVASLACIAWLQSSSGVAAPSGNADWPHWGNTAEDTHFAALDQVDRGNVDKLAVAWTRAEGPGQFAWETFPIVVGRTMYYDTGTDEVFAVDAATGSIRWTYTPAVDFLAGPQITSVEPVSRGVAYGAGRIYLTTADDRLIALDARTGRPLWKTRVADPAKGDTMNSPGTFWDGEVVVGGPAGDAGRRGFVAAYDAATGRRLWRTSTVPAPRKGWNRARGAHGGGDVWMPPVVDPRTGTVYVSTGNPTPAFDGDERPGCNPAADATVALDAKTGKVSWVHAEVCGDSWDYDTTQAPTIIDLKRGDRRVTAIGAASKSGYYSTLDATTGELIARSPYITRYSRPHRVLSWDLRWDRVRPFGLEPGTRIALRCGEPDVPALQARLAKGTRSADARRGRSGGDGRTGRAGNRRDRRARSLRRHSRLAEEAAPARQRRRARHRRRPGPGR